MPTYHLDCLSPRGFRISREAIECADDEEAIIRALAALAGEHVASHIDLWLNGQLVWSSRGDPRTEIRPTDRA